MTATLQESGAREALAREVIGVSAADETEAIVELHDRGLTRFTHNAVHQNLVETDAVVRVRAVVDGRVGVASTNDLAGAGLRACVARAIDLARFAPRDAAFPGLVAGATVTTPAGAYAASTAAATPQTRAEMTRAVFDVAERDRLWSAGYVTTTAHRLTIANTLGTLNSFDGTDAAINVKQNAADASGYGEQYVVDLTTLDATAVAERAARKAREGRAPV
ncbi:MAG: PmbA/TldA family metallopeptidase, partial [Vulcanimicrobiaceae bacterium]